MNAHCYSAELCRMLEYGPPLVSYRISQHVSRWLNTFVLYNFSRCQQMIQHCYSVKFSQHVRMAQHCYSVDSLKISEDESIVLFTYSVGGKFSTYQRAVCGTMHSLSGYLLQEANVRSTLFSGKIHTLFQQRTMIVLKFLQRKSG